MKSKFYFFDSGFREDRTWDFFQKNLEKTCHEKGNHLNLDRNNSQVIRGVYREESTKFVTVFDQKGEPRTIELKNFSSCEFMLHRGKQILIVRNPNRGTTRSLISLFQDASDFQFFADIQSWDLWDAIEHLAKAAKGISLSRIDLISFPYPNGMDGNIVVTGNLIVENLSRFKKGKLIQVHGVCGSSNQDGFTLHSRGILKFSGNMNFKESLDFVNWKTAIPFETFSKEIGQGPSGTTDS